MQLLYPLQLRYSKDLASDIAIRKLLPYRDDLTTERLVSDLETSCFRKIAKLDLKPLYKQGMRVHSLADRLRQSSENRFAVLFEKDRLVRKRKPNTQTIQT